MHNDNIFRVFFTCFLLFSEGILRDSYLSRGRKSIRFPKYMHRNGMISK